MHAKTGTLNNVDNTTATSDPPAVKALSVNLAATTGHEYVHDLFGEQHEGVVIVAAVIVLAVLGVIFL